MSKITFKTPALSSRRLHIFFCMCLTALGNFILAQDVFPSWFKELPPVPDGYYLSVGYAGKFVDKALGKQVALDLAIKNLYKQKGLRLKFKLEEIADGRLRITHPYYEMIYSIDSNTFEGKDFKIVDSLYTENAYFILIISPPDTEIKIKREVLTEWGPRPEWLDELKSRRDSLWGIGIISNYAYWARAWQDADAFAYFDLAKATVLNIESIHTSRRTGKSTIESKITKQEVDLTIQGYSIISRWYNKNKDTYYSLCSSTAK